MSQICNSSGIIIFILILFNVYFIFTLFKNQEKLTNNINRDSMNRDHMSQGASNNLPKYSIIMWNDFATTIPVGWHICDGTKGTPNLTGRFVVAASKITPIGKTGGNITSTATSKFTIEEDQMPQHSHGYIKSGFNGNIECATMENNWNYKCNTARTENAGSGHPISVTSKSFPIVPPYYSLYYIMKIE
jgi:hypothetical protein